MGKAICDVCPYQNIRPITATAGPQRLIFLQGNSPFSSESILLQTNTRFPSTVDLKARQCKLVWSTIYYSTTYQDPKDSVGYPVTFSRHGPIPPPPPPPHHNHQKKRKEKSYWGQKKTANSIGMWGETLGCQLIADQGVGTPCEEDR